MKSNKNGFVKAYIYISFISTAVYLILGGLNLLGILTTYLNIPQLTANALVVAPMPIGFFGICLITLHHIFKEAMKNKHR